MEFVLGLMVVAGIIIFIHGITNNRLRDLENELDDWEGVYDVKRKIDNDLSDESKRDELRNKYNSDA